MLGFALHFLSPAEREPPSEKVLLQAVQRLPNMEKPRPEESGWSVEYFNPESCVNAAFQFQVPKVRLGIPGFNLTGLAFILPFLRPTFFAREAMPLAQEVAKVLGLKGTVPVGSVRGLILDVEATQLLHIWQEANRDAVRSMEATEAQSVSKLPRAHLDEMWQYMSARHALETRYSGKGIYVPRVILVRNKLQKTQLWRAAMWTDMGPAVVPEVDAFVLDKEKKVLGLFSSGESLPVVVKAPLVLEVIRPYLRTVDRPLPHRVLEDVSVKSRIQREISKVLATPFSYFETVSVDEVVDDEE